MVVSEVIPMVEAVAPYAVVLFSFLLGLRLVAFVVDVVTGR